MQVDVLRRMQGRDEALKLISVYEVLSVGFLSNLVILLQSDMVCWHKDMPCNVG